ncbi:MULTISPECIES: hypothetical protein [unclassified Enterococcus]|jgi:hypothetical protein|uniref:hypothetical protein n=1 Tax=unclassified Enterococcus TaxID=2608891 RepID=UPI003D282D19
MNRLAPSIKEEFRKIAFHILRNFELMPKELVHEHRLGGGRENDGLLQEIRTEKTEMASHIYVFLDLFPQK